MTRPAVFLDRDGTVVEEVPYLHDPERLVLLPGVGELAALAAAGYALVVVTNQAGWPGAACTTRRPWPPWSTRCWRARCPRAEKRPDPLRP